MYLEVFGDEQGRSILYNTVHYRSSQWWDSIVMETFEQNDWIQNFRISKETFLYLCDKLKPAIYHHDTQLRRAISVKKRLAITLWCLSTPAEYRTIAHLFGVARSTVCTIVHETCRAIVRILMDSYIKFPCGESLKRVVEGFESNWGFPQCGGAIDGSHIPISAPSLNHYNRKGFYSIVVQAIVDHEYLFRNICVGWPGSIHDARIFSNSNIFNA